MFLNIKCFFAKYKIPLIAGFFTALFAHLFVLVNILHNYDNVAVLPSGYGTGIASGRWFLTILGDFIGKVWGNYNISFFNGLITIGILLLTACLILDLFHVDNVWTGAIWTSVFLCFPTVTSTLFFIYTAPYYALAIAMAVIAVWVTEKFPHGHFLSMLLQACSLGIYQAYFPMTATLFVLLLFSKILEEDSSLKIIIKNGVSYLGYLAGGMLTYFGLLKVSLWYYGKELHDYQGVDSMGKLNLQELPALLIRTFLQFLKMPIKNYYGVTSTKILKFAIIFLGIFSVCAILFLLIQNKHKWPIYMGTIGLCLIFPLAVNSIQIMCPKSYIYTLMIYAAVFIYFLPLILIEKLWKIKSKIAHQLFYSGGGICNIVKIVYGIILFSYIWLSNGNYTAMYYMNRQTENYLTMVITRVQETERFNESYQWVFIGNNFSDPNFKYSWSAYTPYLYGGNTTSLINAYSRNSFIRNFQGYFIPLADTETVEEIKKMDFIKTMPCYPSDGCIKVYEDLIVIKIEELE